MLAPIKRKKAKMMKRLKDKTPSKNSYDADHFNRISFLDVVKLPDVNL